VNKRQRLARQGRARCRFGAAVHSGDLGCTQPGEVWPAAVVAGRRKVGIFFVFFRILNWADKWALYPCQESITFFGTSACKWVQPARFLSIRDEFEFRANCKSLIKYHDV
jgi:hypothetical protein